MKLPWLATRSRALALLVSILFIVCATDAQRFNDTTLGNEAYPGLSDKCVEALNTTVKDCPSFLAAASVDMPRLESSSLKLLCTSACRSSLSSVRRVIDEGCRADKDVIEIRSVVYPGELPMLAFLSLSSWKVRKNGFANRGSNICNRPSYLHLQRFLH